MAKISANYEVVYIIDPAQGEEAVAATVAKFQALAEQHASNVVVEEWGKRRLAYAIDYKTEGYYVLMSFPSGKHRRLFSCGLSAQQPACPEVNHRIDPNHVWSGPSPPHCPSTA